MNTLLIQHVLSDPQQVQRLKQEDLRALTPLIYSHVNPYGMFRLNISERIGKLGQISTNFEVKHRKSARNMGIDHS